MRIKTNELTDAALDWAVAKTEGLSPHVFVERDYGQSAVRSLSRWCGVNVSPVGHDAYAPSTDWLLAGPIIERERISVWLAMDGTWKKDTWAAAYSAMEGEVVLEADDETYGPTPLVAAMRCYVTSHLGDEVDIPDELTTPRGT